MEQFVFVISEVVFVLIFVRPGMSSDVERTKRVVKYFSIWTIITILLLF